MEPSKTNQASTSSPSVGTYTVKSTSPGAPDVVAQIIDPTAKRPPRQADYKIRQVLPSSEGPAVACTPREAIVLDKVPQLGLDKYIVSVAKAVQPAKVLYAGELQPGSVCVFVSDAERAESQHGRILAIDEHSLLMRPLTKEPLVRVLATDVPPLVPDHTIRRYLAMHHKIEVEQIVHLQTGEQPTDNGGHRVLDLARHLYVAADDVAKFPARIKGVQDGWPYTIYFGSEEHWCDACQRVGHFEWICDKGRMAKYIGSRDCWNDTTIPPFTAIHRDPPSTPKQPKGLVPPVFVVTPPSQIVSNESGMSSHDIDQSTAATSPMRSASIKQAQKDVLSLMQNLSLSPSAAKSMTNYPSPGKQALNVENSMTQNLSLSRSKQTLNFGNSLTQNLSLSPSTAKPMTHPSPGKQALNVENSRTQNLSLSPSTAKPMTHPSPGKQALNVENSLTQNLSLSPSTAKPMTHPSPSKQALNVGTSLTQNLTLSPSAAKPKKSNLRRRHSTSILQKIQKLENNPALSPKRWYNITKISRQPETDSSSKSSSTSAASSTASSPSTLKQRTNTLVQNLFPANTTPPESRCCENTAAFQLRPGGASWNASSPTNRYSSPSNAASAHGPSGPTTSSSTIQRQLTRQRVIDIASDEISSYLVIEPSWDSEIRFSHLPRNNSSNSSPAQVLQIDNLPVESDDRRVPFYVNIVKCQTCGRVIDDCYCNTRL